MKKLLLILAFILISSPAWGATPYRWVDPLGTQATTWATCSTETDTPPTVSPLIAGDSAGDKAKYCTLAFANANADDDDVVYLRGGTYTVTTSTNGICPTNSGSASHIITFSGYASETVILHGTDSASGSDPFGVNFHRYVGGVYVGNDFIKVTKMTIENMATNIYLHESNSNEFSYLTITTARDSFNDYPSSHGANTGTVSETTSDGITLKYLESDNANTTRAYSIGILYNATDKSMCRISSSAPSCVDGTCTRTCDSGNPFAPALSYGTANQWTKDDTYEIHPEISNGGIYIASNSKNNWIHHNTVYGYGQYGLKDGGAIIELGGLGNSTATDGCDNNTIEDNNLYWGGHHVLGINGGEYNVIRRNNIRNEAWYDDSSHLADGCGATKCGYRVISSTVQYGAVGGNNLWEDNRIGYGAAYGGPHLAQDLTGNGASGSGTSLATSYNIYRYNDHFFNALYGLRLTSSVGVGSGNRAYNNTFYKNGYGSDDDSEALESYRGGVYMLDGACDTDDQDQVVKNNLFYDHWASSTNNTGTQYAPVYLYNDGYPSAKTNCNYNFGGQTDRTDPKFTDADITDPTEILTKPVLTLEADSTAIDGGTYLTQVNDADGCDADTAVCTALVVDDSTYFQDGTWGSSLATLTLTGSAFLHQSHGRI